MKSWASRIGRVFAVATVAVGASGGALARLQGQSLLPPPTLLAPPDQAEFTYDDPAKATTHLTWQAVPGAASYRLMVDPTPFFDKPLLERQGIREPSASLSGLEPGKYYWRVAALDRDGALGEFSDPARFTIIKRPVSPPGPGPKLVIEAAEPRGNAVQVRGSVTPGATLTVNGQRVEVRPDGTFNEPILLASPGRQTLLFRAVGRDGGATEARRSVVASF
jgi:hypothetical protein